MVSKAEEFIRDVRRAAGLEQKPVVTTDTQLLDADTVAQAIRRAAFWLTPDVVAAYDPAEFVEWPKHIQDELDQAVTDFKAIASDVALSEFHNGQFRRGLQAFQRLTAAVQKLVWTDWEHAANALISRVEGWAVEFKWVTRRVSKELGELLIGNYQLDQLYLHAEGNLYILDPLARFIPGGLGAFDLSIQPSFYVTSVYRHSDGLWYIHLDVGQGVQGARKELLTKEVFHQALVELRSLL